MWLFESVTLNESFESDSWSQFKVIIQLLCYLCYLFIYQLFLTHVEDPYWLGHFRCKTEKPKQIVMSSSGKKYIFLRPPKPHIESKTGSAMWSDSQANDSYESILYNES